MELFLALGLIVASVSAVRRRLVAVRPLDASSITPMTEAGRGHRSVTARWFLVGGIVGGLSLGVLAAVAAVVALADLSDPVRWGSPPSLHWPLPRSTWVPSGSSCRPSSAR